MQLVNWNTTRESGRIDVLARPALTDSPVIFESVERIVADVRVNGDEAVRRNTLAFDNVDLTELRVTPEEIAEAKAFVALDIRNAIDDAIIRVSMFHSACQPRTVRVETVPGVVCERIPVPLQSVGLYVPAGRVPLPSTAIMLCVPATIAECQNVIMCVPPRADGSIDPVVLFAADRCGVRTIFKIGGAQAIAAMAYGTESVPSCDKIFGPGNAYVTAAKQLVSQDPRGASIDMPAGPSEVMVVADGSANPGIIASDLLAQAEHGADSHVILVTTSREVAESVANEIERQLLSLSTSAIATLSVQRGAAIVVDSIDTAVEITNRYAPEHLILLTETPEDLVGSIKTAGSVFLGRWTPETLGDYCSGTNHVLPTYGFARTHSGVSVDSFVRYMTVQKASRSGLERLANTATTLSYAEGLPAHAKAVERRIALSSDPDRI